MTEKNLVLAKETHAIRGAVFEVYREMGGGFLESVYQECLEKQLSRAGIDFVAQPELHLSYKGERLEQVYKPDFICYGQVILEIKAVREIHSDHKAQVINYLKASKLRVGLLANFGSYPKAQVSRFVI